MPKTSRVLITGATGFLGSRLTVRLLEHNKGKVRCLVRSGKGFQRFPDLREHCVERLVEIYEGNLTCFDDATRAIDGIETIYHCAAGKEGPLAAMYLNTVVATRNLLEAATRSKTLKRIVHVSSFSVYGTADLRRNATIDENTPLENNLQRRDDAYTYVKLKQETLVLQYRKKFNLPVVVVRPGVIYGPGGDEISRRVGIQIFGLFLNIGRTNLMPLSYVDNCAEAIVLAGTASGVEGEAINIHDNDLRTCNEFLGGYKKEVKRIRTIKVPYSVFWLFSWLIEAYTRYSKEQIPAVFNRYKTASTWKKREFNNAKLLQLLGWSQTVPTDEGLTRHFRYYRNMYSDHKN